MRRTTGAASIVASPVLVGAVTVLITIVAVFLAYNANQGLPFVPSYEVKAELPSGAKLVKGNEVRVGGFRVGLVDEILPKIVSSGNGGTKAVAVINMKLDKTMEPLARDSQVYVRPRSALGLKYVELTPGRSKQSYAAGATIPLANSREPVEYEDVFGTFDEPTRDNSRVALKGFGDALAGRGPSINSALGALRPFFVYLTPVMRNLSDPRTHLEAFFREIGRSSAQIAPIANIQAQLFSDMADTFAAISRDERALQQTIEKSAPTEDVAIPSLRVQRPFLADFADLSHRLRPAARILPTALPAIVRAFRIGEPVLRRSVALNRRTEDVFNALNDLAKNPNTLLALKDLTTTTTVTAPLATYINPYVSVCDNANYFFAGLGGHIDEDVPQGTAERVILKGPLGTQTQDNNFGTYGSDRPADVPANVEVRNAETPLGAQMQVSHAQPYVPAIDAQGNADCQAGQYGFLDGPFAANGRYPPSNDIPLGDPGSVDKAGGGSHFVGDGDQPGLAGPTYKGLKNLSEVP